MSDDIQVDKKLAKQIGLECLKVIIREEKKHTTRSEITKQLVKIVKDGVDNANKEN